MKNTINKITAAILSAVLLLSIAPIAYSIKSADYKFGDIIQFGTYPQTEVKDDALVTELNSLVPEWDKWTSYGYYKGNGNPGSMTQGDWMRYTDITFNGTKYRGVKFTEYRPYSTRNNNTSGGMQKENGYNINTVYWFRFEPIDWRVLNPDTGLIICESLVDSQPFSNTFYKNDNVTNSYRAYFNDALYTNYANDYETSSIRQWLNNDFYNTAFSMEEKEKIDNTTLNNDGEVSGIEGCEPIDGNQTIDKVFLLSDNEVLEGFRIGGNASDKLLAVATDYAKSQGIAVFGSSTPYHIRTSDWILRTAACDSEKCCYIYFDCVYYGAPVDRTFDGIRPALRCKINEDITDNCSCNCHKSGFMGFIWKIINFFNKLFKTNKICACGVAHY